MKKWIDLRAKGNVISAFVKSEKNTLEEMLKTLDFQESSSCQNEFELRENKIQYGNIAIAGIGMQMLVNVIRNEQVSDKIIIKI